MTAIKIIEESLQWAVEQGYEITFGGCALKYEKCSPGRQRIVGVSALGTVILKHNLIESEAPIPQRVRDIRPAIYDGWLTEMCDLLGTDTYWIWRFCKGFDYGIELTIYKTSIGCFDGFKREKEEKDKVSRLAYNLRKKYRKRIEKAEND